MRLCLLILILSILIIVSPANAENNDQPRIAREGHNIKDFVPRGWSVLAKSKGDLNGDKRKDTIIVIEKVISKYDFPDKKRILLVLFKNKDTDLFRLKLKNRKIIPVRDYETLDEPFLNIEIRNGSIFLSVRAFYSMGGWTYYDSDYQFRFQNNKFVLIGADIYERQRNTGDEVTTSYNFLTHKAKITTSNCDENKKTSWKKLKRRDLLPLNSFDQESILWFSYEPK